MVRTDHDTHQKRNACAAFASLVARGVGKTEKIGNKVFYEGGFELGPREGRRTRNSGGRLFALKPGTVVRYWSPNELGKLCLVVGTFKSANDTQSEEGQLVLWPTGGDEPFLGSHWSLMARLRHDYENDEQLEAAKKKIQEENADVIEELSERAEHWLEEYRRSEAENSKKRASHGSASKRTRTGDVKQFMHSLGALQDQAREAGASSAARVSDGSVPLEVLRLVLQHEETVNREFNNTIRAAFTRQSSGRRARVDDD